MIRRLNEILREEGLRSLLQKIRTRFFCRYYVWVADTAVLAHIPLPSTAQSLTIDAALTEQFHREDPTRFDERRKSLFLKRLDGDEERGFAYRIDDAPAGYLWTRTDRIDDPSIDYKAPLPPDAAYLYDVMTLPAHRRSGVAMALYVLAAAAHEAKGDKRIYQIIAEYNEPSLRLARRLGFRPVRMLTHWAIGPWKRTTEKPIAK